MRTFALVALLLSSVGVSAQPAATAANAPNAAAPSLDCPELELGAHESHQTKTPKPTTRSAPLKLKWRAKIGRTTFRTTMALANGAVVIGTHGATLDGKDEPTDGVYLIDATTGEQRRFIATPGKGDRDAGGVALAGDRIVFGTDNGQLVAADLDGHLAWTVQLHGKVRPAPAVGDLDGDGSPEIVIGDEHGVLTAVHARDGSVLWARQTDRNEYDAQGFIAAAALTDVDGDGVDDVIAGARDGVLRALRGKDAQCLWAVKDSSGIHASPVVGDFDGDGRKDVLAAWSYSDLAVLDARTGAVRWTQELQRDDVGVEGLFATPAILPGKSANDAAVIVAPTAWWNDVDGVVLVGAQRRLFKSREGRVSASPIVADLDADGTSEAIVGTEKGTLLSFSADGVRTVLAQLGGPIEAPAMAADVDGDGKLELLVASNDGFLNCFATAGTANQNVSRFRGASFANRGDAPGARLQWKFAPLPARPPRIEERSAETNRRRE